MRTMKILVWLSLLGMTAVAGELTLGYSSVLEAEFYLAFPDELAIDAFDCCFHTPGGEEHVCTRLEFSLPVNPAELRGGLSPNGCWGYVVATLADRGTVRGDELLVFFLEDPMPWRINQYAYLHSFHFGDDYLYFLGDFYGFTSAWRFPLIAQIAMPPPTEELLEELADQSVETLGPDWQWLLIADTVTPDAAALEAWPPTREYLLTGDQVAGCPWGLPVLRRLDPCGGESSPVVQPSASSHLTGDVCDMGPGAAVDGRFETAWCEGVPGTGVGESLALTFDGEYPLTGVTVLPGYARDPELWGDNARPRRLSLEAADRTFEFELKDEPALQRLELESTVWTDTLRVTILEVYPGERWDDTCIAEVTPRFDSGF
ncbi:MAG TPA: hypothetical protein VM054_09845 [bacterium]|nr:hypothetical protein [bacterium]